MAAKFQQNAGTWLPFNLVFFKKHQIKWQPSTSILLELGCHLIWCFLKNDNLIFPHAPSPRPLRELGGRGASYEIHKIEGLITFWWGGFRDYPTPRSFEIINFVDLVISVFFFKKTPIWPAINIPEYRQV